MPRPAVLSYPRSVDCFKRGFDTLAELLALTLGPTQGVVLASRETGGQPELLNDAATIARRVLQLPDAGEDVGAMLLRNLVWRMHQRMGDGGATTAVLAQALLASADRYIRAGANPALVLRGLRRGVEIALVELDAIAQPVGSEQDYIAVAQAVTGEPEMSYVLGEMFELLGPHAYITVEDYLAPYLDRVYLDGGLWQARLISPYLMNAPTRRKAILSGLKVAIFDGDISQAEDLRPLLEAALQTEPKQLLLAAGEITGEALNTLVATHQQGDLKIIAVNVKRGGEKRRADFEDLSVLTGAQVLAPVLGRSLKSFRPEDFGRARRAEAGPDELFVVGGGGAGSAVREQIQTLDARLHRLPFEDENRLELQMRLARLSGSAAVLKIGALTKAERQVLHQKAEQSIKALRAALKNGVVPGSGAAYLHTVPAVQAAAADCSADEAWGLKAVSHALEAPFRRILLNAHREAPGVVLQALLEAGPEFTFDAVKGEISPALEAGILDPAAVARAALETAASGAAMAISTQTIVLKRRPRVSYNP